MENVLKVENFNELREEKSLLKYLAALNFHDLMIEAESALMELNKGIICKDQIVKVKTILKEFSNRLKSDADGFSANLTLINNSFEEKFSKLKELI